VNASKKHAVLMIVAISPMLKLVKHICPVANQRVIQIAGKFFFEFSSRRKPSIYKLIY
jgi:hypothetical protein